MIPERYQCFKHIIARIVSGASLALSGVTTSEALEKILSEGTLVAIIKKLIMKLIIIK